MNAKGQWFAAWRNVVTVTGRLMSEYRIASGPVLPEGWLGEIGLTHPQAHSMVEYWRWIDPPRRSLFTP